MGRRETYTIRFSCPGCLAQGEATWEENSTPPHHGGRLNPNLEGITEGFRRTGENEDTTIECTTCQQPVNPS